MYLHIIHCTGETVSIDVSRTSSWQRNKDLKYWQKKHHVKEVYLSYDKTPGQPTRKK